MNLSVRIAYNYLIQVIGKIISTFLGLLAMAMIARYLGTHGFGEYTTALNFISFFAILADLGFTLVTIQMLSNQNEQEEENILTNLLSLRFFSAVLILGIGSLIIIFFNYSFEIKKAAFILALSFLFNSLSQILTGLFQKKLKMKVVALAEIWGRVFLVSGIYLSIILKQWIYGIVIATVISNLVQFFYLYFHSRFSIRLKIAYDIIIWKKILRKAFPLAITISLNLIYLKTDIFILSFLKTSEDVGLYGASSKVLEVITSLPFMFAGITLPILTSLWNKNQINNFKRVLQKSLDAMSVFALPLIIGTQFTAEKIMNLVAGQEFNASGPILKISMLTAGIIFIQCVFSHAIIALDRQKSTIPFYAFTALTSVIGYLIFIPYYSYFGAAWMSAYSELTVVIFSGYLVWKFTGFRPSLIIFFKSLIACGSMSLILIFLKNINLFFLICSSASVYLITLYFLNGLNFLPIQEIKNLLKKE